MSSKVATSARTSAPSCKRGRQHHITLLYINLAITVSYCPRYLFSEECTLVIQSQYSANMSNKSWPSG